MALLGSGCGSSISYWSDNVQQRRTFGPASSQPSLRLGTSNFVKGSGCLLTHPRPSHRLRLTPPPKDMVVAAEQSLHDFSVKDIDQKDVSLSKYKGKVLLIVNVASRCGYTASNYTDLTSLYQKLKGEDFEILAFPCNQFGGQEPGTNQEIKEFACSRFKAEYPIFDKVDVNGSNTAPVYEFLKSSKSSGPPESDVVHHKVSWNFAKFLLDKNGQVVQSYGSSTSPLAIEENIRNLLSA